MFAGGNNRRHTVMDLSKQIVCFNGDDAERPLPISRRVSPVLPDSGNSERLSVFLEKLVEPTFLLFVERIHRHDGSTLPVSFFEHRLFDDRLRSRVDRLNFGTRNRSTNIERQGVYANSTGDLRANVRGMLAGSFALALLPSHRSSNKKRRRRSVSERNLQRPVVTCEAVGAITTRGVGSGPPLTLFGSVRSVRGNRKFHVPFFRANVDPWPAASDHFCRAQPAACGPVGARPRLWCRSGEPLLSISMTDHITGSDGLSNANPNNAGGRLGRRPLRLQPAVPWRRSVGHASRRTSRGRQLRRPLLLGQGLVNKHYRRSLFDVRAEQDGIPIRQPDAPMGFGFADFRRIGRAVETISLRR
jgi:hypothetical protein